MRPRFALLAALLTILFLGAPAMAASSLEGAWQLQVGGELRSFRVRERIRSNNSGHLLSAACAGLGIMQAPSIIAADAIASGTLQLVLPECTPPPSQLSVVYPKSRKASQKVQTLLAFLIDRMATLADWDERIGKRQTTA